MKYVILLFLLAISNSSFSQELKLRKRSADALSGSEFSKSISDTTLTVADLEGRIYHEIMSGNVPDFLRKLAQIQDSMVIAGKLHTIRYYVLPDYLAIGSDSDYFYCPMRPQLAQKISNKLKYSLPTRKISDQIYLNAPVKLNPQPIPPSAEMVTVPIFENHNLMVQEQRRPSLNQFPLGSLTAGNKKDVVISNKIFDKNNQLRVVIYGWHKPDGKAIQPLYNGHTTRHVDYSHGIRLIQKKVWVDGKRTSIQKILKSKSLHPLLSDEGVILQPYYPAK